MSDKHILLSSLCFNCKELKNSMEHFKRTTELYDHTSMLIYVAKSDDADGIIEQYKDETHLRIKSIDHSSVTDKCVVRDLNNQACYLEIKSILLNDMFGEIEKYTEVDFVVLFDPAIDRSLPIHHILKITHRVGFFDMILSCDYDSDEFVAAYRSNKCPAGVEIYGQHWQKELSRQIKKEINSSDAELIPVHSGYGSISIINRRSIGSCRCSIIPCEELDVYYRSICNELIISTNTSINGCMTGMFLHYPSRIFYRITSNVNYPIVHPFVNFCFEMRKTHSIHVYVHKKLRWDT